MCCLLSSWAAAMTWVSVGSGSDAWEGASRALAAATRAWMVGMAARDATRAARWAVSSARVISWGLFAGVRCRSSVMGAGWDCCEVTWSVVLVGSAGLVGLLG